MNKQNVTLVLPITLLRKVKSLAARTDKSLSRLLREALEEKISADSGYKKAKSRQLKTLERGLDLGTQGLLKISREKLHERS